MGIGAIEKMAAEHLNDDDECDEEDDGDLENDAELLVSVLTVPPPPFPYPLPGFTVFSAGNLRVN